MRHAGEIHDHGFAADRLSEAERELGAASGVVVRSQQLPKIDLLTGLVGQFNADDVPPGNHRDTCRQSTHGACDIVREADHPRRFDAGCGLKLIERHDRPRPRIDNLATHTEIRQHMFKGGCVLPYSLHARRGAFGRLWRCEQIERGQLVSVGGLAIRPRRFST